MKSRNLVLAALAATVTLGLAFDATAPRSIARAEDPPAAPPAETADQKATAFLKETKSAMSKQADADAKTAIAALVKIWKDEAVTDEVKKGVLDLLPRNAKEVDKPEVAKEAIAAFGELSPAEGAKLALDAIGACLKTKAPIKEYYSAGFASLKKLADPSKSTVSALVDSLKYKDDEVIGKAADAIAGYKAAPGKVRKELFEELLKQTEGVAAGAKQADNANAKRKWNIIMSNVNAAFQALSGQNLADPAAARQWFNDNKKNEKAWS